MKLIASIVFSLVFSTSYSQLASLYSGRDFKEKQADTVNIKIDSILIVGMGSSVTRAFLNDVSNIMIEKLNIQKIAASYFYLGKNAEEASKEFDIVNKTGYKAILFLLPSDTALFDTKYSTITNRKESAYGPIAISSTTAVTSYKQKFNFKLCQVGKKNENFWSASIDIDCDPGKKHAAKKVVKKVFNRFRAHKYID
jgi:hypothetical protein